MFSSVVGTGGVGIDGAWPGAALLAQGSTIDVQLDAGESLFLGNTSGANLMVAGGGSRITGGQDTVVNVGTVGVNIIAQVGSQISFGNFVLAPGAPSAVFVPPINQIAYDGSYVATNTAPLSFVP